MPAASVPSTKRTGDGPLRGGGGAAPGGASASRWQPGASATASRRSAALRLLRAATDVRPRMLRRPDVPLLESVGDRLEARALQRAVLRFAGHVPAAAGLAVDDRAVLVAREGELAVFDTAQERGGEPGAGLVQHDDRAAAERIVHD